MQEAKYQSVSGPAKTEPKAPITGSKALHSIVGRRSVVKGFAGGLGALLAGRAVVSEPASAAPAEPPPVLNIPEEDRPKPMLRVEDLKGQIVKEYAHYAQKNFKYGEEPIKTTLTGLVDRSRAEMLKTDKGLVISMELDPEIILDSEFTRLKIQYDNGGTDQDPANKDPRTKESETVYLPIESVLSLIANSDPDKSPSERRMRLFMTNDSLGQDYANVIILPQVKLSPRLPGEPGWHSNVEEAVTITAVTDTTRIQRNAGGEPILIPTESENFKIYFPLQPLGKQGRGA